MSFQNGARPTSSACCRLLGFLGGLGSGASRPYSSYWKRNGFLGLYLGGGGSFTSLPRLVRMRRVAGTTGKFREVIRALAPDWPLDLQWLERVKRVEKRDLRGRGRLGRQMLFHGIFHMVVKI